MLRSLTSKVLNNNGRLHCIRSLSTSNESDVIVIGSGPGGYVAAIKAAQLGLKTTCIEKNSTLGGTCLNVGCIPSKTLLNASHEYYKIKNKYIDKLGISVLNLNMDIEKMLKNKSNIVTQLTGGIEMLFKKNKINWEKGHGKIIDKNTVALLNENGDVDKELKTKNIIIATGSEVSPFPGIEINEKNIVSSTGALNLTEIPPKMIVIGAGVIGLELGSVWSRLGSQVTCIEFLDTIGGVGIDKEVSSNLEKILKKQGLKFLKSHKVLSASNGSNIKVTVENMKKAENLEIDCDTLLICTGRKPFTDNLGLENLNVNTDDKGRIEVNDMCQSSHKNVFAIGDCIKGPMLAHKAEDEGIVVAEFISKGIEPHLNYDAVPSVLYTHPEVAWVGKSEEDLKQNNIPYKVGKFPILANGRAKTVGESDGFIKVLAHKDTDRLLGISIIASCAGELINEAALCIEYGASSEDLARVCHAHPTVAESLREAALSAYCGNAIHI
ncbi:hypothetical protein A3Q56_01257 [Intoshia linei]|uniref:Dihydrolipoyl dehydrogenase n=1 Tax=Intoshia linei TaxID=1819745 RepID=A0A177BC38_9BILA|nr:hypothetical protein A3Q56_01257 [Intoshia linei]